MPGHPIAANQQTLCTSWHPTHLHDIGRQQQRRSKAQPKPGHHSAATQVLAAQRQQRLRQYVQHGQGACMRGRSMAAAELAGCGWHIACIHMLPSMQAHAVRVLLLLRSQPCLQALAAQPGSSPPTGPPWPGAAAGAGCSAAGRRLPAAGLGGQGSVARAAAWWLPAGLPARIGRMACTVEGMGG